MSKKDKKLHKKKHRGLKVFFGLVIVIVLFMVTINIIPPSKVMENNRFVAQDGKTMLCAHRGGSVNNPENTLMAFKACVEDYQTDIVETDFWLTKDEKLVYNHDGYIDRVSDVNGDKPLSEVMEMIEDESKRHYIKDYTLDELRNFNFGYYFEDENGNRPYKILSDNPGAQLLPAKRLALKAAGLQIVELDELFDTFYETHPELLFNVEIKDPGEAGYKAGNLLDDSLTNKYPLYKSNVVVSTFHDEIEKDLKINHPSLLRGASTGVATKFIITEILNVNLFDNDKFVALQIPMSYDLGFTLKLDSKKYIDAAHKRNIAVQYWTINEKEDMEHLVDLGCDAIMSDNPKLLRSVLDAKQK